MSYISHYMTVSDKEINDQTTHVVSLWYIPGGYDYSSAKVVELFFCDEENAKSCFKEFENSPEMAVICTAAKYKEITKKILDKEQKKA